MGRPKKQHTEETPPEQKALESQPPDAPAANGHSTISKAQAVREALAAGMEKPDDGVNFIKSHYGLDMTNQMWSTYKAQQKMRDAKAAGGEAQPHRPTAPVPAPRASNDDGALELVEALKPLITRYGKDKLTRWINVLG